MELLCKLRVICDELYNKTHEKKYILIKNILEHDDCFFCMDMETSIRLLNDLCIDNSLDMYKQLISPDSYKEVKQIFTVFN